MLEQYIAELKQKYLSLQELFKPEWAQHVLIAKRMTQEEIAKLRRFHVIARAPEHGGHDTLSLVIGMNYRSMTDEEFADRMNR